MFIVVNDIPINVWSIKKITDIVTIHDTTYNVALWLWLREYGVDPPKVIDSNWAREIYVRCAKGEDKIPDTKPYHKILNYINDATIAICGEGIFYPGRDGEKRLKMPYEIPWKQIPDAYFFGINFNGKMSNLGSEAELDDRFTGEVNDLVLYSKIYFNLEEAVSARNHLEEVVKMLKDQAEIIKI